MFQQHASRPTQNRTQKQLLTTLAFSGAAFLLSGFAIQRFAAPPTLTVLIDRSYCPATQWKTLSDNYAQLYHRHQQKKVSIESVVLVSDLSQTVLETLPTPSDVALLKTYGKPNPQAMSDLSAGGHDVQLLSCRRVGKQKRVLYRILFRYTRRNVLTA